MGDTERNTAITIESRFCITVCQHERQSKIWQRYSLIDGPLSAYLGEIEQDSFFAITRKIAAQINSELKKHYVERMKECFKRRAPDIGDRVFSFHAACSGSSEQSLKSAFEKKFEQQSEQQLDEDEERALLDRFNLIGADLKELPSTKLQDNDGGEVVEKYIGFAAYRRPVTITDTSGFSGLNSTAHSEVNHLCGHVALKYDRQEASFYCVGYDNAPVSASHRRSFGHIVSGEILAEYGQLY